MPWRLLIVSVLSLTILSATAYAASAETTPRLGSPTNVTITQIVSLRKLQAKWTAPEHAKKYVVKLMRGKTVILKKIVKQAQLTFSENKVVDGTAYRVRIRARATSTYAASPWKTKKFTFNDLDVDDDGIVNDDDDDDDADGIADEDDEQLYDHDNDGTIDSEDDDDDNDLIDDPDDAYPFDHDNDGDPDSTDPDDDNDGILDVDEAPGQQFDEDNDGIPDYLDEDYIAEHSPTETFTIKIKNNGFVDGDITIQVGDTVQWVNKDEGGHSVAASDGSFESPPLESGESYSHTFTAAGTFEYYDPTAADVDALSGTITVTE